MRKQSERWREDLPPKQPKTDTSLHDLIAIAKRMSMPKVEDRFEEEKSLGVNEYEQNLIQHR